MDGIFGAKQLAVEIGDKTLTVDKNDTKDIILEKGEYSLILSNSEGASKYDLNLRYDTCIVVSWNCESEELTVSEEL